MIRLFSGIIAWILILFTDHYMGAFLIALVGNALSSLIEADEGPTERDRDDGADESDTQDEQPFYSETDYESAYKTLGLQSTATNAEVKAAFRTLAMAYHPDVCKDPDATAKFQAIQWAYETIKMQRGMK